MLALQPNLGHALPVEVIDRNNVAEADLTTILDLHLSAFPPWTMTSTERAAEIREIRADLDKFPENHERRPRIFAIRDAGQVIAKATIFPREIATTDGKLWIMAVAQTVVTKELRYRGLGTSLMRAAFQLVDDGHFAFSIYQTSHAVSVFYKKLGAVVVTNPIINSRGRNPEKRARPFVDDVVMRYPADRPWPAGEIDLLGSGY
jgi:GNAT superfamily N-acetyltransferase